MTVDDEASPPLWRDAVVGASIAAMAAAAGFGTHYEVGAAPWLSGVAAAVTVAALWGAHRQFGGRRSGPSRTGSVRRPPQSAPRVEPSRTADELPDLAMFTPRTLAPHSVAGATPPMPLPADLPPVAAMSAAAKGGQARQVAAPLGAGPGPVTTAPVAMPATMPVEAPSVIDPEVQFLHLQGLVRQLAAELPGPRAATIDPDQVAGRRQEPGARGHETFAAQPVAPRTVAPTVQTGTVTPMARLAEAVAAERFDVLLEPIQALAEARTRHFEISLRFRDADGNALAQDETVRIARSTGLATSIDVLKLPRVAKVVQRVKSRGGTPSDVMALFAGASLADHHFMEAFANAFPVGVPGQLVLSFPQADVRSFARVHWGALSALADMGLRYALADVSDLDMDFEQLRARSFVFAKLEAGVFMDGLPCAGSVVSPADICSHLARSGLEVIVTGLDSDQDLSRIAPYGVILGQGRLFGGARPVKADVLQ